MLHLIEKAENTHDLPQGMNSADDAGQTLCRKIQIFPGLQHNRLQAHVSGVFRHFDNGIFINPVSFKIGIVSPQPAVTAVVAADV